jgi:hypothetical protein
MHTVKEGGLSGLVTPCTGRNCLPFEERILVTVRRGQLLDDKMETRRCSKLKEETLDSTVGRNCFRYRPVVKTDNEMSDCRRKKKIR